MMDGQVQIMISIFILLEESLFYFGSSNYDQRNISRIFLDLAPHSHIILWCMQDF
ncbi:unnamed protein product [Paramecium sonneborni]|uniref:Uncharacterized protein n=1 Tax=Paramecium sonneborni TaxID=65129 RepID=A0A8S1RWM7_9CILI|nr:unnamed protein product [Paramecium sonneborni]